MWTTRHRALAAVVGLGGCAIAIDKLVIGYSDPSGAGAAVATLVERATGTPAPVEAAKPAARRGPAAGTDAKLLERIERLSTDDDRAPGLEDPFAQQAWEVVPAAPAAVNADGARAIAAVREPLPALRVSSTVMPGKNHTGPAIAVINGQRVTIGETVSGMRVERISATGVVLSRGAERVELMIPRSSNGTGDSEREGPRTPVNRDS